MFNQTSLFVISVFSMAMVYTNYSVSQKAEPIVLSKPYPYKKH